MTEINGDSSFMVWPSLGCQTARLQETRIATLNAMHGPDPSPDLSPVRSPCLNRPTNPHPSPAWSPGPHPGLDPDRG